jgi:Ni,Fe-hydrogenase III large subunit
VDRLDIRTPTLANWTSVTTSLVGRNLADLPVVVVAIDPCLSCTSRITVVDTGRRETSVVTWEELSEHGRQYYREREGV